MSRTRLEVTQDPAGVRPRLLVRTGGPRGKGHLGVRTLSAVGAQARVGLVAEGALLVVGDHLEIAIVVGDGMRLDVVEPAGTVAFDMRGGSAAWTATIEVGEGACLCWHGEPWVVSTGACVDRQVRVTLHESAVALIRDAVVLGRSGETGGMLSQRLRVTTPTGPLLVEDLLVDGAREQVGVLGGHRVVDTLSVLGRRATGVPTPRSAHRLELEGEGTVLRYLGMALHLSPLASAWRALVAGTTPDVIGVGRTPWGGSDPPR